MAGCVTSNTNDVTQVIQAVDMAPYTVMTSRRQPYDKIYELQQFTNRWCDLTAIVTKHTTVTTVTKHIDRVKGDLQTVNATSTTDTTTKSYGNFCNMIDWAEFVIKLKGKKE
jgi:hypothetical protein